MSCGSCDSGAAVSSKANADFMPKSPRLVYRIDGVFVNGKPTSFRRCFPDARGPSPGARVAPVGALSGWGCCWVPTNRSPAAPGTPSRAGRADGCEALQIFARPAAAVARPADAAGRGLDVPQRARHRRLAGDVARLVPHQPVRRRSGDPGQEPRRAGRGAACAPRSWASTSWCCTRARTSAPGARTGIDAAAESLSEVHERTRGVRVRLLLEITAGQGSCLGCRFDDMAAMLERARAAATRWASASTPATPTRRGSTSAPKRATSARSTAFARTIGLDRLRAFHLNDSKTPAGSRVDRHAEIGDGYLGLLPFWRLVNDPRFATVPGVLETPHGPDKLPVVRPQPRPPARADRRPPPARPAQIAGAARQDRPAPGPAVRLTRRRAPTDDLHGRE